MYRNASTHLEVFCRFACATGQEVQAYHCSHQFFKSYMEVIIARLDRLVHGLLHVTTARIPLTVNSGYNSEFMFCNKRMKREKEKIKAVIND
jgi:hypothetical protein